MLKDIQTELSVMNPMEGFQSKETIGFVQHRGFFYVSSKVRNPVSYSIIEKTKISMQSNGATDKDQKDFTLVPKNFVELYELYQSVL